MDILCPKCGEPWEIDTLHEYAEEQGSTFAQVSKSFRARGCGVAFEAWSLGECRTAPMSGMLAVLAEIMGDDIDGYASACEDLPAFIDD
jgi:hypothetical protein